MKINCEKVKDEIIRQCADVTQIEVDLSLEDKGVDQIVVINLTFYVRPSLVMDLQFTACGTVSDIPEVLLCAHDVKTWPDDCNTVCEVPVLTTELIVYHILSYIAQFR